MEAVKPLALRMRPNDLEEFVGQEHIVGPGSALRKAIESDLLTSLIFYGPTGCGKTALAWVIAKRTKASFVQLNAVSAGVSDVRKVVEEARHRLSLVGRRTILFIDEIHRFNKAQQDALLPYVEDGTVILIGATTENPYFEVIKPLVSRSLVVRFEPLRPQDIQKILSRAIEDRERGLGNYRVWVEPKALEYIVSESNGDARRGLNILEVAALGTAPGEDGVRRVTLEAAVAASQRRVVPYDKAGDLHYDTISAFIKSMRGSDPDAAVYWLGRMIYAGEDPLFIARRIVICAAEDVGLADPQALAVATAAMQCVHFIGLPEAKIPLAEAAIYVALAPKSNSAYLAIEKALQLVETTPISGVPPHLRDASYAGAEKLGHGAGYIYPHDHELHYVEQQYLPDELRGARIYEPGSMGVEPQLVERWKAFRSRAPS